MKKAIATTIAAVGASIALAAPAHAAGTSLDTPYRMVSHESDQGYFLITGNHAIMNYPRRAQALRQCATHDCRLEVRSQYRGLRFVWRSYNRQVWAAAEGLPNCASLADTENCVYNDSVSAYSVVKLDGATYFVQTSTKPTA